jgi:hypothetical protein
MKLSSISVRKLKCLITTELAERAMKSSPYLIVHNITDHTKKTIDDKRLTKSTLSYYLRKKLGIDTNGLKNPAYFTAFTDFEKFSDKLRKMSGSFLVKVGNTYSAMRVCNTDLLDFKSMYPILFHIISSRYKYGLVRLLTFRQPTPEALVDGTPEDTAPPTKTAV